MDGIKPASLLLPSLHYTERWRRVKRWDRDRKSCSVFLFLFRFFILFLRGENAAAGEACRRCFGFYCVSPSSRSTKDFLPPPSHSLTPSPPPQRPINVTSPSPCPAPPRDFLFFLIGFAFSFYFPLFLFQIPSKLQYGQVQYSKSPRVDEVIHQAFHFHHIFLICSPGLDFGINPCVSSGVRWLSCFLFLFAPLWKINKSPLSFKCSANLLQKTEWFHRQQKHLLLSSSSSTLSW